MFKAIARSYRSVRLHRFT